MAEFSRTHLFCIPEISTSRPERALIQNNHKPPSIWSIKPIFSRLLFFRCRICGIGGGNSKQSRHGPENSTRTITALFAVFLVGKFDAHDTKPTQFAEWLSNYFRRMDGYYTRRFQLLCFENFPRRYYFSAELCAIWSFPVSK